MARAGSTKSRVLNTAFAATLGFLMMFPIRAPLEVLLRSGWTLESSAAMQARSDHLNHFMNSVVISLGSTVLGLLIAIPAAWTMAFVPGTRTKDVLMWILLNRMLPPVKGWCRSP